MLDGIDNVEPYMTRQLLLRFKQDMENSQHLCETKKRIIGRLLQEIVDTWNCEDYV